MTEMGLPIHSPLFSFAISKEFDIAVSFSGWIVLVIVFIFLVLILWLRVKGRVGLGNFELDSASFGIGDTTLSFRPNRTDRQIAYAIWVELSTRKIGLEIDLEHDVISEVYNSWYDFFAVTRELIKEVPAHNLKNKSTRAIVRTSVQVLNEGLRPHLTQWQARFRRWFEVASTDDSRDPQLVQKEFSRYDELVADLLSINAKLIGFRKAMYELATGDTESVIAIDGKDTGEL